MMLPLIFFSFFSLATPGWSPIQEDPSVVEIVIRTPSSRCTGTYISNSGHVLTARHCLNSCLISGGYTNSQPLIFPFLGQPKYGDQVPMRYYPNYWQPILCPVLINGQQEIIEVLATSESFVIPRVQYSLRFLDEDIYSTLLESYSLHNGDFAIIKTYHNNTTCRLTATNPSQTGDSVSYVGFPGRSSGRPEGRNSDGVRQYTSQGILTESILENQCIENANESSESLTTRFDRPELLISTVDLVPGASGASLLNSQMEILAVLNSQYSPGVDMTRHYCRGGAIAISIDFIKENLLSHLTEESVEEIFNCQSL